MSQLLRHCSQKPVSHSQIQIGIVDTLNLFREVDLRKRNICHVVFVEMKRGVLRYTTILIYCPPQKSEICLTSVLSMNFEDGNRILAVIMSSYETEISRFMKLMFQKKKCFRHKSICMVNFNLRPSENMATLYIYLNNVL